MLGDVGVGVLSTRVLDRGLDHLRSLTSHVISNMYSCTLVDMHTDPRLGDRRVERESGRRETKVGASTQTHSDTDTQTDKQTYINTHTRARTHIKKRRVKDGGVKKKGNRQRETIRLDENY